MIPWVTLRPSPVPSPTPFVVKNGSKMRSRCSVGDAVALVPDLDHGALALDLAASRRRCGAGVASCNGHGPALRHRVDRVDDEVRDRLLDLRGVDVRADGLARRIDDDLDVRLLRERRRAGSPRARLSSRSSASRALRRATPREVEQLADDQRHAVGLRGDDLAALAAPPPSGPHRRRSSSRASR